MKNKQKKQKREISNYAISNGICLYHHYF